MSIFDYVVKSYDGKDISLCNYMGEVLLIVNTATRCGFTKQYEKLQELYDKYKDNGLVILDFPCNQFSHQAPESDLQIHEFRKDKYNVGFPQFKKINVNGKNALPLFEYLKFEANIKKIEWNFEKFLINREGKIVKHFKSESDFEDIENEIKKVI